jgi:hypothetical protein
MATEIYTPPQELPVTSKIYGLPFVRLMIRGLQFTKTPIRLHSWATLAWWGMNQLQRVGHEPTATVA